MSSCSDPVYHILTLLTIRINGRSELSCYREAAKKQDKQGCGQIREQKNYRKISSQTGNRGYKDTQKSN